MPRVYRRREKLRPRRNPVTYCAVYRNKSHREVLQGNTKMKNFTALAFLAAFAVSAFAQTNMSSPSWTPARPGMVMAAEYPELPDNYDSRQLFIREKVYKYAGQIGPSVQYDLEMFDRSASPDRADALFAGLYNAHITSMEVRREKALANISPELRATLAPMPMMAMNEDEDNGRALRMIVDRPRKTISDYEGNKILTSYQNAAGAALIEEAYYTSGERTQAAVLRFLRATAMEADKPIYASTLIQRNYSFTPMPVTSGQ